MGLSNNELSAIAVQLRHAKRLFINDQPAQWFEVAGAIEVTTSMIEQGDTATLILSAAVIGPDGTENKYGFFADQFHQARLLDDGRLQIPGPDNQTVLLRWQ